MSYEGDSRVVDVPLADMNRRPDVVTCPHCRGTGVVLRKKLSPGQLRKSEQEQDELETKRQRVGERSGGNRSPPYYRRSDDRETQSFSPGRQVEPWRKNEREMPSFSSGRQNESWKRNRQSDWKPTNLGPRRQNQNWSGKADDIWQEEPTFDDRFPEPNSEPNFNKQRKQQRKRQRKRQEFDRMNNADLGFPAQYPSLLADDEESPYDYHRDQFNSAPLPLMPLPLMPPPGPAATGHGPRPRPPANHSPRRRPRPGNRQQFPEDEPMSDVDLFSLGVLYASCMQ